MYTFEKAIYFLGKGFKVRDKKWPDLYYIYNQDSEIFDSQGNLFFHDLQLYIKVFNDVESASGSEWELYYEVEDENL